MRPAEAEVSHTSGLATFLKKMSGPATDLAMASGLASAMRLGTSSPMTMLT